MERIINKYNNSLDYGNTFMSRFGGTLGLNVIIIIIMILSLFYIYLLGNIQKYKNTWIERRCDLTVLPFAGFIDRNKGETINQATQRNFVGCVQNLMNTFTKYQLSPIEYILKFFALLFGELSQSVNLFRLIINRIRKMTQDFILNVASRVSNSLVPFMKINFALRDIFEKFKAISVTVIFSFITAFYGLKSLLGSIINSIVQYLIVMSIIIISLWMTPLTTGAAAAATAVYIVIAALLSVVVVALSKSLGIKPDNPIPGKPKRPRPKCFSPNVKLIMNDGSIKKIKDLEPGDILENNNIVLSSIKLSSSDLNMYNVENGIIVSGDHKIMTSMGIIYVEDYKNKTKIDYDESFVYCISCSKKYIEISPDSGNTKFYFLDWDEVYSDQHEEIIYKLHKYFCLIYPSFNRQFSPFKIIEHIKGGYQWNTKIILNNGNFNVIKNIKVGDILFSNNKVYGIVKISSRSLKNSEYKYHLLTEKGNFMYITNKKEKTSLDYNGSFDKYINLVKNH